MNPIQCLLKSPIDLILPTVLFLPISATTLNHTFFSLNILTVTTALNVKRYFICSYSHIFFTQNTVYMLLVLYDLCKDLLCESKHVFRYLNENIGKQTATCLGDI